MIISSGIGPVVLLIASVIAISVDNWILKKVLEPGDLSSFLSILPASAFIWFVGKKFNANAEEVEIGKRIKFRQGHSVMFVNIEYWAFIFPVVLIIVSFQFK